MYIVHIKTEDCENYYAVYNKKPTKHELLLKLCSSSYGIYNYDDVNDTAEITIKKVEVEDD